MLSTFNRLVHVSWTGAFHARGLEASCPVSTRFEGLSTLRVDILCGIFVAVVSGAALWAGPLSDVERKIGQDVSTAAAPFGRWEEAVHKPQLPAVSLAFVSEHSLELAEAGIADRFGEATVANHASHVQVFNADTVVSVDQIGSNLVEMVFSGVADMFLYSSNTNALPVSPSAAFLATGKNTLRPGKSSVVFARVPGVWYSRSVAQGSQATDSKVYAYRLTGRLQSHKGFIENQRNEISSAGQFGDRDGCWRRHERSTPSNIQSPQSTYDHVGIVGVRPGELKRRSSVFGTLLATLLFERRISGFFVEESDKCVVEVPKSLLDRNAGDFFKPCGFGVFLPFGQFCGTLVVPDPFFSHLPCVSPIPQPTVVNVPAATEYLRKLSLLGVSGVESKFVSNLHTYSIYA